MSVQIWKASVAEAAQTGFNHFAKVDYEGIANNATSSNQLTIATIPAGGAVECCGVYESVALVGASDITIDVGTTSGDPDEFIDAGDLDAGTPLYNTGDAFDAGTATVANASLGIALRRLPPSKSASFKSNFR